VHTLALMANHTDSPLKSEFIACFVKTNPVVIRRLLPELAKADLVETQSGAHGGSRLKKQPEAISLWEIYQAVEMSAAFSVHQPLSEGECSVSRNIESVLINVQNRVDKAVWQTLRCITLAEILQLIKDGGGDEDDDSTPGKQCGEASSDAGQI
ncbi:MAG TPA: Rrf2 family transcriptional regulator, partial [Pyrinomonadaceae bacterium]|nr:Rrf2 family transcriptional regulator [Pyrinomonadaceae bacterium]